MDHQFKKRKLIDESHELQLTIGIGLQDYHNTIVFMYIVIIRSERLCVLKSVVEALETR